MRARKVSGAGVIAVALALVLVQSAIAAPGFIAKGQGSIQIGHGVNLDTGDFNGPGPNDVSLQIINSKRYLVTEGSVLILHMPSMPTFSDCKNAALVNQNYRTSRNVGDWFCLKTDHNRFAYLKIVSNTSGQPLPIRYGTWCKPSDNCVGP